MCGNMVDKELIEVNDVVKYHWIKNEDPECYDIYWVVIKNKTTNTYEATICNFIADPDWPYWECLEDEEVICWMPFENFIPKIPITLMGG